MRLGCCMGALGRSHAEGAARVSEQKLAAAAAEHRARTDGNSSSSCIHRATTTDSSRVNTTALSEQYIRLHTCRISSRIILALPSPFVAKASVSGCSELRLVASSYKSHSQLTRGKTSYTYPPGASRANMQTSNLDPS